VREHTPSNTDVGSNEGLRRKDLHLQGQCRTALKLAGKLIAWRCLNVIAPGMLVHIMDPSGHWSQLHCNKTDGEIPVYTHDDAGQQRSTTGKYFPYESGVNTCFAPAVFNTFGDILHEKK
jgi:hypothetical protein